MFFLLISLQFKLKDERVFMLCFDLHVLEAVAEPGFWSSKKTFKDGYVKFRRRFGLLKKYLKIGCVKFRRRFLTYET